MNKPVAAPLAMKLQRCVPARDALAFTLVELLIVIAIIAILAALLFPVLGKAKANAQRTTCLNNLEQINRAIQLYAGENRDFLPMIDDMTYNAFGGGSGTNLFLFFYKPLVMHYLGLQGSPSPDDKVFACPADKFFYLGPPTAACYSVSLHDQLDSNYSSYGYNGSSSPGLFNQKLTAITDPAKTVLVAELAAFWPYTWHDPERPAAGDFGFSNARDLISFADGHASFIRLYLNTNVYQITCNYDPPAGYNYKWSAN